MDFYKTFLDLQLEDKMQSDEGKELRVVLKSKIQEGQMCLDQLTIGLKHSESQLQIIDNHLKHNVTAVQRKTLLAKQAAFVTVRSIKAIKSVEFVCSVSDNLKWVHPNWYKQIAEELKKTYSSIELQSVVLNH